MHGCMDCIMFLFIREWLFVFRNNREIIPFRAKQDTDAKRRCLCSPCLGLFHDNDGVLYIIPYLINIKYILYIPDVRSGTGPPGRPGSGQRAGGEHTACRLSGGRYHTHNHSL